MLVLALVSVATLRFHSYFPQGLRLTRCFVLATEIACTGVTKAMCEKGNLSGEC